jgi:hypothetical protein
VQAEIGPDRELVYGIIERHAIRAVPGRELERVAPLAEERKSKE